MESSQSSEKFSLLYVCLDSEYFHTCLFLAWEWKRKCCLDSSLLMINCWRGSTQQARIQRFGWENCCMVAHCILLENSFLWGYAQVQTAILCYKVTLKLIFRSVETVQALQGSGQSLGVCPWGKSSWRQENECMRFFSLFAVYRPAKLPLPWAPRFVPCASAGFDRYPFQDMTQLCHGKEQIGYPERAQWILCAPLAGSTQTFQGTWQQCL